MRGRQMSWRVFGLLFVMLTSGCSLIDVSEQAREADGGAVIRGDVRLAGQQRGAVMVVLFLQNGPGHVEEIRHELTDERGQFQFHVLPGRYFIGAYVDVNADGRYQPNEEAVMHGTPTPVQVAQQDERYIRLTIRDRLAIEPDAEMTVLRQTRLSEQNIGRIVSLTDPVFDPGIGSLGLWRPMEYLRKIGAGLYLLEPYKPGLVPVVLIHGANGGPADWLKLLQSIDRKHFTPWILAYPSGLRLDVVSDYLEEAVARLVSRYAVKRIFVVAHSMGGLVARSFVFKWRKRHPSRRSVVSFLMTINSPLAGMPQARSGVRHSPIVVPSWRDVASGSTFLTKLNKKAWPEDVKWELVFSYKHGEGDDGVVALESQLPLPLQYQASRIFGFQAQHAGILGAPVFHQHVRRRLAAARGKPAP